MGKGNVGKQLTKEGASKTAKTPTTPTPNDAHQSSHRRQPKHQASQGKETSTERYSQAETRAGKAQEAPTSDAHHPQL